MPSLREKTQHFQEALADWYATAQRPLPWRTEPSLYRTVVSELMAQQTQIKTMLPYFERWMQRFPDFDALANAPTEDVLKHWEGLGYYSRARNLHKLAKAYVAASPKPKTRHEWKALPGVGPYTSAAIASISFQEPVAVVDGNVVRILARLTGEARVFSSNGEAVKAFTKLADEIINHDNPGDHNQAMMELGATVCLKRQPMCTLCPVNKFCDSYGREDLAMIPRIERRATETIAVDRALVVQDKHLLLYQIPEESGQLAGQYELAELGMLGMQKPSEPPLTLKTRSITHRRFKESIHQVELTPELEATIRRDAALHWIALETLEAITLSGPHRRWVRELLE